MESNDATSVELKICRCQIWISPEYLRVLQVIFLYHPENQELDKMAENFEKKKKKGILLIFVPIYCPQELICPTWS